VGSLLINSLVTALFATAVALVFGFAVALFVSALPARGQRLVLLLAIVALALPPFAVANCWLHYLGATGIWRSWLPLDLFNNWGVAWILALMLWPITFGAVWSAWQTLDSSHLDAEPGLCGASLVRWLLFPVARDVMIAAIVLTFALALNQFSVPAIFQVKVLPVEFWIRFSTNLEAGKALAACWPIILIPFAAWLLLRRARISWPSEGTRTSGRCFRRQLGTPLFVLAAITSVVVIGLSVALPLVQLIGSSRTWHELPQVFKASAPTTANTFVFAAVAGAAAVVIGLWSWRFRVGALLWLIFLTPGMLLAIFLTAILNRPTLEIVYRSAAIVMIALCLRYVGPVWALLRQAFMGVDRAVVEAATLDGLRGWGLIRHVYLPQAARAMFASWYVAYLLCLWDVETVALLYPPGAETLALRVFNLLHYGHMAQVNALCLILMGMAVAPALLYVLLRPVVFGRRAV
jgi:iron(III) transport system permease protein